MLNFLRKELKTLISEIRKTDRKVVLIFISTAVFTTVSWYYTSRRFFRIYLYDYFRFSDNADLIEFYYWFIGDFFSFFILPALLIKFLFKEKISSYGVNRGDYKAGLKIIILFYLIMLPFLWLASSYSSFERIYPHILSARESWTIFVIYETGLLFYMFAWEFIWRGYMLFGLKEKFGYYAIFIQTIPFVILHNGKPAAETFGAIAAGIALGILALRTGSIIYGFIIHGSVLITIDFISVLRYKTGEYGTGINSIYNIFKNILG